MTSQSAASIQPVLQDPIKSPSSLNRRNSDGSLSSGPPTPTAESSPHVAKGKHTFDTWHDKYAGAIKLRRGSGTWGSGYKWTSVSSTCQTVGEQASSPGTPPAAGATETPANEKHPRKMSLGDFFRGEMSVVPDDPFDVRSFMLVEMYIGI
ncbi:hypothetical protein M427DRAFT_42277 [Gonapodya prolifera JEL478]|uniref:Uncharacterized protein n=1 Tax=Gonapodya prolifera (strain JEL478) TaxID=1344416 RepID=A0A139AP80_GONPJ|nr:hypothetical protein M427DRAFT_42277 [Gonapodya prolifera JEL478]|eukprot:KXS18550.1 hypothetical protein M427DRAFT_42277 [Gonapodya prolifera JEL478]